MSNHFPTDNKLQGSGAKFRDVPSIDARLNELEQEKQQLIALKEELQGNRSFHHVLPRANAQL